MDEIYIDRTLPYQEQLVELGGATYTLRINYSQREDRYYFSLYDSEGSKPLIVGIKIVCDFPLVRGRAVDFLGELVASSNERTDRSPPGLGELGSSDDLARVQLFYVPAV